jgi:hypothetical protein
MQNQILSMLLDIIMAGLLLATIVYCLKLNRRITLLQDSRSELARIIREFDASTTRATQNINEIHTATNRISENIQLKIDKANYLANDLEMMIERGNKMAGKTEAPPLRSAPSAAPSRTMADIMPARSPEAPRAEAAPSATEATPEGATRRPLRMRSRAEQELMSLIGGKKQNESGG